MLSDFGHSPGDEPRSLTQPAPAADTETQLVALLQQTNHLLEELLATLRGATPPVQAAQPQPQPQAEAFVPTLELDGTAWAAQWADYINRAFALATPAATREYLLNAIASNHENVVFVDFCDRGEYQQNRSYAEFSANTNGCCMLLPYLDMEEEVYAAFPYPTSSTWFLLGKDVLQAVYDIYGNEQSVAPKLQIRQIATMKRTDRVTRNGDPIFVPLGRGELIAQPAE